MGALGDHARHDHSMDTTPTKVSMTPEIEGAGVPGNAFTVVQNGSVDFVYLADRKAPACRARRALEDDARGDPRRPRASRKLSTASGTEPTAEEAHRPQGPPRLERGQAHRRHRRRPRRRRRVLGTEPCPATPSWATTAPHRPRTTSCQWSAAGRRSRPAPSTATRSARSSATTTSPSTVMRLFGLKAPKNSVGSPIKARVRARHAPQAALAFMG